MSSQTAGLIELSAAVQRAALSYQPPGMEVLDRVADELLSPGGRLASAKTFTRDDVIVAVAPMLHGLPVSVLDSAVDRVLSHGVQSSPRPCARRERHDVRRRRG